ncbi:uncharacterized protein LOC107025156 [Solanum pennellii]|uniref:Uncharacterized protein LOC107025156 n=1 Tax=Solanum pennellii TaxID=28526 RepID=A0ABM1H7F8_SOLPN|nr:uncharacterized protein LOC107025156 [Solanum pennellii]
MVKGMMSRRSLFLAGLGRLTRKEGRTAMLIGAMDISMLMVYVQQVEEEKLRGRESSEVRKLRQGISLGSRRHKEVVGLLHILGVVEPTQVSVVMARQVVQVWARGSLHEKCPKNKQGGGYPGHRAQSLSVAPTDKVAPRGATSGTAGGANCLYAITSRQKQ